MSPAEPPQVEFSDDPHESAFVVEVDGERVGKAEYLMREGRHVFVHTEVDPEHSGSGLAARLVQFALDDLRARGGRVVPMCPFVRVYIRRHPDYEDLVDRDMTTSLMKKHE